MNYLKTAFFILCLLNTMCMAKPTIKEQSKQVPHQRAEISLSYAPIVKKVAPAVVNIYTTLHTKIKLPHSREAFQERLAQLVVVSGNSSLTQASPSSYAKFRLMTADKIFKP